MVEVDLSKPRYDQSTFLGRLRHFVELIDPRMLLASQQDLAEAKSLVQDYEKQRASSSSGWLVGKATATKDFSERDADRLWHAKYLLDATFHPDTQEPVLLPFRMSAFVPVNLFITAGLLIPQPSIATIVFWQWVNQSFNVGFNWANANKTTQMSTQETAIAYGTAVTASVSVAVGLSRIVKNPLLARFVPFAAVGSAGVLNVFLMRRKELTEGIGVYDKQGQLLGKSQTAGWLAVSQVAISRVATSFPCLTLPPLIMSRLENTRLFRGSPTMSFVANLTLITGAMMTALPAAVALFPQYGTVSVDKLEDRFHNLIDKSTGKRIEEVTYNKGI